jgi:serine/threonine protein phosphatase PrpC
VEKLGKLSRIRPRAVSENTQDKSFAVEISGPTAGDFFWASAAHHLEAGPEAEKKSASIFCGIFDGHGQWGHYVAKAVRDSLPPSLLCHWQEAVALASLIDGEKVLCDYQFDLWRQSYLAAAAAVDEELRRSRRLDAFNSGCTALSVVKQGDMMVVANVGDSRAVLATTSDDGGVAAVQLTVDSKPNLPRK